MKRYILTREELAIREAKINPAEPIYTDFAALIMSLRYLVPVGVQLHEILNRKITICLENYTRVYYHTREEAEYDLAVYVDDRDNNKVVSISYEKIDNHGYFQVYHLINGVPEVRQLLQVDLDNPTNINWSTDPEEDREIFSH